MLPDVAEWSRWQPLVAVSPSGKTIFVCVICGQRGTSPGKCSSVLDYKRVGQWMTCEEIEKDIIETQRRSLTPARKAMAAENYLQPTEEQWCRMCHGWGCQVCGGTGTYMGCFR